MAETPVSTASTPAKPESTIVKIEQDFSWVKAHMLTAVLTATMLGGAVYGTAHFFQAEMDKHDARVAAEQQAAEGVNTATQAALLAQLQQERTDDQARDAAATAQITSLIAQLQANRQQTAKQIATDQTLDAKTAADRLIGQTKATAADVTVNNDIVSLSLPLTRKVVSDEDQLAEDQTEIPNLQGQLTASQTIETDTKQQLDTATKTIAADKTELITTIEADNATCKVQLDQQAEKARKRSLWLMILSAIGGFAARSAL